MPRHAGVLSTVRSVLGSLAEAAVTPLVPSDYLDLLVPLRPGAHRAKVVALRRETADAVTVVLRPAGRWPGHRAGQYLRVGVEVDGVRWWRSYSLTGPVGADGTLTITVSAVAGGRVSQYVVRRMRVGALVELEGPDGAFTLPGPAPAKVAFVTAGSGLTPVIGMLRTSLADLRDVVVVHSARTADDVLFGAELRALAASGAVRLVERHTTRDGRLDAAALEAAVPDLATRETWVCGPNGLVDAVTALFDERGWAGRLHTERFRPVVAVTGDGGTLTFTRSGTVVEADGSAPLLEAGEGAGVLLPSGCRMGICFGCVVPLTEGAVRDVRNGALTTAAPGDGVLVQTCVNAPAGHCTIDA